ncbi:MAG: hypothetical protein SCH71_11445 [Desulfobulbaceae bacterium]|nr:hypothetical protein [Desulfobulbaceae bacterium]
MKEKKKNNSFAGLIFVTAALCLALITGMPAHTAMAADSDQGQDTGVTTGDTTDTDGDAGDESAAPSFSNPAQAQHAANLAQAAASEPDGELESLQSDVAQAEKELSNAIASGAPETEIQSAEEKLTLAEEAYANEIAERTGVLTGEIAAMRTDGMGWGQIAHELGVHPGLLGLGHTEREKNKERNRFANAEKNTETAEIAEATERNTKSGWSKGHGVGLNAGVDSTSRTKGYGLGLAKKDATGGISGAAGLGGNKSRGEAAGSGKGAAGSDGGPGNSGGDKGGNGKGKSGDKGNNGGGKGKGGGKSK